jgi:hypothetical protein
MDDLKAIDMMHKYFRGLAGPAVQTPQERTEKYVKLRKIMEKFLDWYEGITAIRFDEKSTDFTMNPITKAKLYFALPESTNVPELKNYEKDMIPILNDFCKRGVKVDNVREQLESFLDKFKENAKPI